MNRVSLTPLVAIGRNSAARAGVRIELFTVVWMTLEAAIGIGAGIAARSVLLTAFGLDSVIELVSGGVLLWRLLREARGGTTERVERAERRAAWIVGIALSLLCLYVVVTALAALVLQVRPDASLVGIGLAASALLVMPVLARAKQRIAAHLGSAALRGDAACSITCAWMAGALLAGLALNAAFHLWWADAVAALALLIWLVPEAREALTNARAGKAACGCGDDACRA